MLSLNLFVSLRLGIYIQSLFLSVPFIFAYYTYEDRHTSRQETYTYMRAYTHAYIHTHTHTPQGCDRRSCSRPAAAGSDFPPRPRAISDLAIFASSFSLQTQVLSSAIDHVLQRCTHDGLSFISCCLPPSPEGKKPNA